MEKKYIFVNGVMKLNPAYQAQQKSSIAQPQKAVAVVSSTNDISEASELMEKNGREMPLAESTTASMEMMQDPEFTDKFSKKGFFGRKTQIDGGELLDKLTNSFAKYEVPVGLVNKLLALMEYKLNFIIDDSSSMGSLTDTLFSDTSEHFKDKYKDHYSTGSEITRWHEVEDRLYAMMEILSYIPTNGMTIRFLNNSKTITLEKPETPESFFDKAKKAISKEFDKGPNGNTPIYQALSDSLNNTSGSTMHYLFTDGEPSDASTDEISALVIKRSNPQSNPLTFISCTSQDKVTEWMKAIDEDASFTAEVDDFGDEKKEVLKDQGAGFPYSKGFWLLCQLVGAINPDDLDGIDENYPFTKMTFDNLMGRVLTREEYLLYFNQNPHAQKTYRHLEEEFLRTDIMAKEIPLVRANMQKQNDLARQNAKASCSYLPGRSRP